MNWHLLILISKTCVRHHFLLGAYVGPNSSMTWQHLIPLSIGHDAMTPHSIMTLQKGWLGRCLLLSMQRLHHRPNWWLNNILEGSCGRRWLQDVHYIDIVTDSSSSLKEFWHVDKVVPDRPAVTLIYL